MKSIRLVERCRTLDGTKCHVSLTWSEHHPNQVRATVAFLDAVSPEVDGRFLDIADLELAPTWLDAGTWPLWTEHTRTDPGKHAVVSTRLVGALLLAIGALAVTE